MTIETQVSKVRYTGTGFVATYPYTFPILSDGDLVVIEVDTAGGETTLTLDTDYTVTGAGTESGGNVVLGENLTSGHVLVIYRELDLVQETDLANQQAYFLETIEDALDYQTMTIQQLQEQVDRSLKLGVTDTRDPEDIVDDIFEARDDAQTAAAAAASAAEAAASAAEAAESAVVGSLALGETSTTAYRGDRGKTAYDHSQTAHAPSDAQKNSDITKEEIEAVLTGELSSHTHAASAPSVSYPITVANGGTGATTAATALEALGGVGRDMGSANVGSLAIVTYRTSGNTLSAGSTYSGSSLSIASMYLDATVENPQFKGGSPGAALSGTWRALTNGTSPASNKYATALAQRIA